MSRALSTLAVIATLLLGCATGSRSAISRPYDKSHAGQIQVTVENYVHRDVTVYIMNGGLSTRIGRCSMGARCNWWLTSRRTQNVVAEGDIVLGWRWAVERSFIPNPDGSQEMHGIGQIPAWDSMEAVLRLTQTQWYIYPGIDNVREAD